MKQYVGNACGTVGLLHSLGNCTNYLTFSRWPQWLMFVCQLVASLVPRPHPLTRRNSLVNQVEFLGLVHGFATVNFKTHKSRVLEWRWTNFTVVREVLPNNYRSHNLIGPLFTRLFLAGRCTQAGHETNWYYQNSWLFLPKMTASCNR